MNTSPEISQDVLTPDQAIDLFERRMLEELPVIDCPLVHRFTPGMYIREITMAAGSLITSKIHRTTHPFFVLKGKVSVYSDNDGVQLIEAPYVGITTPGTRRVLYIHQDCIWATVHAITDGETVDEIEARIIEPHENPLIGDAYWKMIEQIKQEQLQEKEVIS